MKLFDKVYIVDQFKGFDKVPGIIVEDLGEFKVVDTIVGGVFKVAVKHLDLMPEPKVIIQIKREVSEKELRNFKKQWESCIKNSKSVVRAPIITE